MLNLQLFISASVPEKRVPSRAEMHLYTSPVLSFGATMVKVFSSSTSDGRSQAPEMSIPSSYNRRTSKRFRKGRSYNLCRISAF